jgi:glutathione S-transferase
VRCLPPFARAIVGAMRTLYHFQFSPFSRRVRLALAHKALPCELREGRSNQAHWDEARKLWAPRTLPVLVEDDGRVLGDSNAIVRYLDHAYPGRALWPKGGDALRVSLDIAALVDSALNTLVDVGTRFYALRDHAEWKGVRDEMVGRAQAALDALGSRVAAIGPRPLTDDGWSAADMWLYTAVAWLDGLPARAAQSPNAAQIVSLAWALPAPLVRWTEAFREREDVRALG